MVDYSKWDHIEVSDDEDETHPNIDTPSLFRWRHSARVERMEEAKKEKDSVLTQSDLTRDKLEDMRKLLEKLKTEGAEEEKIKQKAEELKKLEDEQKKWREKEAEIEKKEKLTPWNVDTLSKDGFQKTIINKYEAKEEDLSEDQLEEKQRKFVEKNEKEIKKFGMYKKIEDSQKYLVDHPHLACEQTANYLVIWCIDLEEEGDFQEIIQYTMKEVRRTKMKISSDIIPAKTFLFQKTNLMRQVSHQTITIQFLLELAKNVKEDPRACIRPFFSKLKLAEEQYMVAFDDELTAFIGRVKERAKMRHQRKKELAEQQAKQEEEEKKSRLGPGGLDPAEVFETLPEIMQKCFESQDIPLLQKSIQEMDMEEAQYHMKRCIDSGLWLPEGGKKSQEVAEGEEMVQEEEEEEDVYVDVKETLDDES